MRTGLLLGKFMPLHKGHLALINFALQHCDFLYIIICFTQKEPIDGIIRKQWLYSELHLHKNIRLVSFPYSEEVLPNTSESSRSVSKKWAAELKKVIPDADIIFTSEPYGNYLAGYMGIKHTPFDIPRETFPVSASMIRKEPLKYWDFLADSAKPWYVKKIVLLGSESTGKTTLTRKLAKHYNTVYVPEMAREITEKTADCTFDLLETIAVVHAKKTGATIPDANKLLFIDTDITITKSYSRYLFNRELVVEPWITDINKADLYLFLETDCPFVQDGTRLSKEERDRLSLSHKEELKRNNISFVSVSGGWDDRFQSACSIIEKKFALNHA